MKRYLFLFIFIFILSGCKKNKIYDKKNNSIYFGSYPTTLETNNKQIEKLNKKINNTPTTSNNYDWISFNYYSNNEKMDYMFYKDIDLNNDNINDYRAVYLTSYRPIQTDYESSEYSSHQDNNGYFINNTYYFKYEKIKWDILEEKKGNALLISSLVIDSMEYYPSLDESSYEHNGGLGYSNNYELSNIRKWLNEDFYNLAFNNKEKEIIKLMEIDNMNTDIINDNYKCNNTSDKVTLLSYNDARVKYYNNDNDRRASASDYAKSLGVFEAPNKSVTYRLRTPSSYSPINAYYIDYDGAIHGEGVATKGFIVNTDYGVRPVIEIKL